MNWKGFELSVYFRTDLPATLNGSAHSYVDAVLNDVVEDVESSAVGEIQPSVVAEDRIVAYGCIGCGVPYAITVVVRNIVVDLVVAAENEADAGPGGIVVGSDVADGRIGNLPAAAGIQVDPPPVVVMEPAAVDEPVVAVRIDAMAIAVTHDTGGVVADTRAACSLSVLPPVAVDIQIDHFRIIRFPLHSRSPCVSYFKIFES